MEVAAAVPGVDGVAGLRGVGRRCEVCHDAVVHGAGKHLKCAHRLSNVHVCTHPALRDLRSLEPKWLRIAYMT